VFQPIFVQQLRFSLLFYPSPTAEQMEAQHPYQV